MGRGAEQLFFQIRHTDDQQTHEKTLNITNHQGNANQNRNEVPPHTCQNDYQQKDNKIVSVGEDVEKREPLYTVGGIVNWGSHYGKQYGGSSKS